MIKEVDLTEWVEDTVIMRWSVEERTRWEGEGGLIPSKPVPWWLYYTAGMKTREQILAQHVEAAKKARRRLKIQRAARLQRGNVSHEAI
jgi:hypothetical protein